MVQLSNVELVPQLLLPRALFALGALAITCEAEIQPNSIESLIDIGAGRGTVTANVTGIAGEKNLLAQQLPPERCRAYMPINAGADFGCLSPNPTEPAAAAMDGFECVSPAYPHAVAAATEQQPLCPSLTATLIADRNAAGAAQQA